MIAYKLFKVRKDGSIGPLFINAKLRLETGRWYDAEDHPTKGYAHRPGWHCSIEPSTEHLSEKGRTWYVVEIKNFYRFPRPAHQGGEWLIAKQIRVLSPVNRNKGALVMSVTRSWQRRIESATYVAANGHAIKVTKCPPKVAEGAYDPECVKASRIEGSDKVIAGRVLAQIEEE